ncbi:MAG: NupC/NupG family nucleoside CNT transporter [Myxococcales bacterium]|nr:MAG: NupC/NupG family nucleoside CNT transporter [Myxococcales bacterium]
MERLISLFGVVFMIGCAWLMSSHKRKVPWRIVIWGVGLQLCFGVFVLRSSAGQWLFSNLNGAVNQLLSFTTDGARFIFGKYLDDEFTFALNVLPTIVFFSSLMALLYHYGVMQRIVKGMAWAMQRTMRTSGSETVCVTSNIFVGQTEAPLVVRPFLAGMTQSELMTVMVSGFATVAGGVLAAYVGMLRMSFPDIAGHLVAASVMNAPAALVVAKVMVPETKPSETANSLSVHVEKQDVNGIDAATRGAGDGMRLALNVGAMLLAFVALVAMLNYFLALPALWHNQAVWKDAALALGKLGIGLPQGCVEPKGAAGYGQCIDQAIRLGHLPAADFLSWNPWTLQRILGYLFWPFAFVMGVPLQDCATVAGLLGEKLVLNEFVAYGHLGEILNSATQQLHPRSSTIVAYALCGFANLGSIAIQIGGIGSLAPERRADLAHLGMRAMLGGTLATFMTASVAGLLAI